MLDFGRRGERRRQLDLGRRGDHRRQLDLGHRAGAGAPTWCSTSATAAFTGASSPTWCSTSAPARGPGARFGPRAERQHAPPLVLDSAPRRAPTRRLVLDLRRPQRRVSRRIRNAHSVQLNRRTRDRTASSSAGVIAAIATPSPAVTLHAPWQ